MTLEEAKIVMGTMYHSEYSAERIATALRVMFDNRYVLYSDPEIRHLQEAKSKLDAIQSRAKKFFGITE